MKKLLCFGMIVFMLVISMCGCVSDSGTNNNNANNQINDEPKIVDLTVDNIEEYITFSTNISDPDVFEPVYADNMSCEVKLTVKTASKQNVEYNNLQVGFKVVAESTTVGYGWDKIYFADTETEFNGTLNLPYNGVWEDVFELESEFKRYVTDDPELKIIITSVSGEAKFK